MFGLIALGLFAASTISSTTLIGGGVVVAGATAYGVKKYCDKVEEDNRLRVLNTQKQFEVKVASIQREADSAVREHGEEKIIDILRRAFAQDVHFYESLFRVDDCRFLIENDHRKAKITQIKSQSQGEIRAAEELIDEAAAEREESERKVLKLLDENNQLKSEIHSFKVRVEMLKEHYEKIGRIEHFKMVLDIVKDNTVLNEIISALQARNANGDINNKGILRMVEGYFLELAFLFSELYRICKPGAKVAFVNDNVRYAGEVIPVDYLCTDIAEKLGFKPVKIYTLRQKKGNSSQQMAKFGRVALRKSITIWEKSFDVIPPQHKNT